MFGVVRQKDVEGIVNKNKELLGEIKKLKSKIKQRAQQKYYIKGDEPCLIDSINAMSYAISGKEIEEKGSKHGSFDSQADADKYAAMLEEMQGKIDTASSNCTHYADMCIELEKELDQYKAKRKAKKKEKRLAKQEAELREVVKVGQKFKHLGIEYVVAKFELGSYEAGVTCEYKDIDGEISSRVFYHHELDLLKALVKK